MTNYLIVDLSYFLFYRFFATRVWFSKAHPEIPTPEEFDFSNNIIFMEKIEKLIMDNIATYLRKFKVLSSNIHLVKDCPRTDIWRTYIYPEYKKNRDEHYAKTSFQGGKVFKKCYDTIIPKIIDLWNCNYWLHPHLEADDIISILISHYSSSTDNQIYILSSDTDLLSCLKENTIFIDSKGTSWNNKSYSKKDPFLNILYKEILGDPGDNVPKWFTGVGEKTATTIIEKPIKKLEYFKKDSKALERLAINRILVSFDFIPDIYKKDIQDLLS